MKPEIKNKKSIVITIILILVLIIVGIVAIVYFAYDHNQKKYKDNRNLVFGDWKTPSDDIISFQINDPDTVDLEENDYSGLTEEEIIMKKGEKELERIEKESENRFATAQYEYESVRNEKGDLVLVNISALAEHIKGIPLTKTEEKNNYAEVHIPNEYSENKSTLPTITINGKKLRITKISKESMTIENVTLKRVS